MALVFVVAGCAAPATQQTQSTQAQSAQRDASSQAPSERATPDYSQVRVSYLGPEGTYTQEACGTFFNAQGTYVPAEDVAASVQALLRGEVDYAVIPQENSIGGAIPAYLDEVVGHAEVSVAGEVELPINQNLLTHKDVALGDVKTVYSHAQGFAQTKAWIAENLPDAAVVEVSSTAEGAKMAAEDASGTCAAIGSAAAADVYGLVVAAEAISECQRVGALLA